MTRIVLDASIAVAWAVPTQATILTEELLAGAHHLRFAAPACLEYEVRNVLLRLERRRQLTADYTDAFLLDLASYDVKLDQPPEMPTIDGAMELARAHGVSLFDGLYLDLAIRGGLPLAACDQRMIEAALLRRVTVVTVENLR